MTPATRAAGRAIGASAAQEHVPDLEQSPPAAPTWPGSGARECSRPGKTSVRIAACSALIGLLAHSTSARRGSSAAGAAGRARRCPRSASVAASDRPAPREHVDHHPPAEALVGAQAADRVGVRRHRAPGRDSSPTTRATSSTRSISRVVSAARQVGTCQPPSTARRSRAASATRSICASVYADRRSGLLEPLAAAAARTGGCGRSPCRSIVPGTSFAPASSTISWEASASARGGRCGSRPFSHRLEPSVRRPEPDRRGLGRRPVEVGALHQHGGGLVGDLAPLGAHQAGDRRRLLGVGDHERHRCRACGPGRRASSRARRQWPGAR